ncbi:hypothetical protein ACTFIV_006453 [Dictyostelium citrinum]
MGDLFFKVYRNLFLREKIFNYIKISNQYYLTFNYYEFPLSLIIKTRNEILLIEKINFLILKNHQKDNYKHFINFNYYCLYKLFKWKELDFQIFYKIYKIFQFEIEQQFKNVSTSTDTLLVSIENYETLKFIVDIFNPSFYDCKNLEKFSFSPNDESKQRFKILLDLIIVGHHHQQVNKINFEASIFKVLEKIVEKKLSKEFGTIVLDKIGLFESSTANQTFLEKIIEYSDEYMFKLVLEIFKKKLNSNMDPFDSKIKVYDTKVSIKTIDQFKIKPISLMNSSMVVLLKVMISLPNDFIKKLKSSLVDSMITIKDPSIAQLVLNTRSFDSILNYVKFLPTCLNNDLSNAAQLSKRAPTTIWRGISSPEYISVEKFQFLIKNGIDLQKIFDSNCTFPIQNDLQLVKLYIKYYKPPLTLLLSVAYQNHQEILNFLIENYWFDHFKGIISTIGRFRVFDGNNYFSLLELSIKYDQQLLFYSLDLDLIKQLKIPDIQNSLENMYERLLQSPPICREPRLKFFNKLNHLPYFKEYISKKTNEYKTKILDHQFFECFEKSNKKLLPFILKHWSCEISTSENPVQFEKNEFLKILLLCINNNWVFFIDQYLKKQLVYNKSNTFKKKLFKNLMVSNPRVIVYLISIGFFSEKEIEHILENFIKSNNHHFTIKLIDFILFSKNELRHLLIGILKSSLKSQNNSLLEYLLNVKRTDPNQLKINSN